MNSGIPWELLVGGMTFGDKGLGSIEREIHWAENFMKPTKLPLHNIMLKLSVSHPNGLQQGKLWVSLLLDFAGKSIYKILLLNTVQFRNPELFTEGHILLLLSRFSHVQLCATPWMAAHQAPLSLGFSRQEHWVSCHFLPQCMKVKSESEVAQSCLTLHDPMDCSPPGSSVHGIFQARVLQWGAIAFSRPHTS